jgi:tetratricopeptide (TPR) repeat protein
MHLQKTFEFDRFVLKPGIGLYRDGKLCSLKPKALSVLQYLIEERGRRVTREDLLARVWSFKYLRKNYSFFSNQIDAIREEIGQKAIEFKHGLGYQFCLEVREISPTIESLAQTEALKARQIIMGPFERRDLEEAGAHAEKALEADSSSSFAWAVRALVWALYLHRGWVGDEKPEALIEEIMRCASLALKQNTSEGDAWFALGILAAFQGSYFDAEIHYMKALEFDPKNPVILSALGFLKVKQNRFGEALILFQQSAIIDPMNPIRQFDLAALSAGMHSYGEAWDHATRAINLQPIVNAISLKAFLAGAWKGDFSEMKSILGMLSFADRSLDEALHMIMWCGLLRREPQEVIEAAERTSKKYIEHWIVFSGPVGWYRALAYRIQGNSLLETFYWKEAREELKSRLEKAGGLHAHYRVQLATTLAWLGKREEARRVVQVVEAEWEGANLTAGRARELAGYYASIGDARNAIPMLERALAADSGPGGLTTHLLHADPWWDKLRDTPEFRNRFPRN